MPKAQSETTEKEKQNGKKINQKHVQRERERVDRKVEEDWQRHRISVQW